MMRRLLVVAGSDSSGGAGIQADIKTACAFGVFAMAAVTAVTAQDTTGVHAIHPVPAKIVRAQIACCLADIGADAIKIGMLGSGEIAEAVADVLEGDARGIPLVLDPVLASTSGTPLLDERGIEVMRNRLLPLATLVTPNIPEAEVLSGNHTSGSALIPLAGQRLRGLGARAVLIKGGHSNGDLIEDVLVWDGGSETYAFPRIDTRHIHGTGCTLATAIACGLAEGLSLPVAVGRAREYVQAAIATAPGFGKGHGPLNHLKQEM
ncbi:MAG: bifunctional hydroxymethylpyrimidine kinase/phosphomethylpyrimidine kinase [Rhizomicrobium sp.]|jgi:hydroxymethylpyrimidine/phosphomethylpyrimidine kinase